MARNSHNPVETSSGTAVADESAFTPPNGFTENTSIMVEARNLRKEYRTGNQPLVLFEDLNLIVHRGEMVAIVGESGSGKSTLLHLLAALDRPSAGDVYCASTWLGKLTSGQAAVFRNREIGYVWQMHYLLPEFTALENAAMPLLARNEPKPAAYEKARQLLSEVGLEARTHHRAGELSGGEQQRVSLARALVTEPALLLADEPTGNLDNRAADAVFSLLTRLHSSHRLTSILVTHNMEIARCCGRVLRLHGGQLQEIPLAEVPVNPAVAGLAPNSTLNPRGESSHLKACTGTSGNRTHETA